MEEKPGDFLKSISSFAANFDWQELFEKSLSSDISAKPMQDYFAPLKSYL